MGAPLVKWHALGGPYSSAVSIPGFIIIRSTSKAACMPSFSLVESYNRMYKSAFAHRLVEQNAHSDEELCDCSVT